MKRALVVVFVCTCYTNAHAYVRDTIVLRNNKHPILHTLTLSPLYLLKPVVRVSYEYRLSVDEGIEFSMLVGRQNGWPAWGFAFHYVYYLFGDFEHGVPFGFEYWYTHVSDPTTPIGIRDRGLGQVFLLGYKYTTNSGFTASIMGSAGIVGTGGPPDRQPLSDLRGALALNLAVGWSF